MATTRVSDCGRFVVIERLHLDRRIFDGLRTWASPRGLPLQDALQLAACALIAEPAEESIVWHAASSVDTG